MSTYANLQDIEGELKGINFKADTAMTSAQVTKFIKQESAMMNGKLSRKYATPILSEDYEEAYLILNKICTHLVAERIRYKLDIKSGSDTTDQDLVKNKAYSDLEDILTGKIILSGVPTVSTNGGVSSNCLEDGCDVNDCHEFKSGVDQW
jgi:hypothetical protein